MVSSLMLSGCVTMGMGASGNADISEVAVATQSKEKLDAGYRELLLSHGSHALDSEKYEEAVSAYKRILSVEPENPDAIFGMAETMLATGSNAEALGYYRLLDKHDAFRSRALQGEGIVLLNLGQQQMGLDVLRKAVASDETLWRAWNALGRTLDIQSNHEEALKSYNRALALIPSSALVLNNRGVSYMLAGRYKEAEVDLRRAVSVDRELSRARSNLRLALAWQGKYAEALADVSRIDAPAALNNIGYIAMQRGDMSHAEAYFVQAMQTSPVFYDKADRNLKFLIETKKLQKVAETKKS
jgi:Flp pilus assembly protein TadD